MKTIYDCVCLNCYNLWTVDKIKPVECPKCKIQFTMKPLTIDIRRTIDPEDGQTE